MNYREDRETLKHRSLSIRLTEEEFRKMNKVCRRDEIKPAAFVRSAAFKALESLIQKQEREGYSCQTI